LTEFETHDFVDISTFFGVESFPQGNVENNADPAKPLCEKTVKCFKYQYFARIVENISRTRMKH